MENEDAEIGMKVVPFQKTAFDQYLHNSVVWNRAKRMKQKFLYVTMFDREEGFWVLAPSMDSSGDYFNAEDFKLYAEEEVVSVKLTKTVDEIIFVESKDGYHKASIKQTNGNWSSIHFWYVDIDGETNHAEIDLSQFGFLIDTLTELQKQIEVKKSQ